MKKVINKKIISSIFLIFIFMLLINIFFINQKEIITIKANERNHYGSMNSEKTVENGDYYENQVIVIYSKNKFENSLEVNICSLINDFSIEKTIKFEDIDKSISDDDMVFSLITSNKHSTEELINILSKKSWVKGVYPNYKLESTSITNDEYVDYQWALDNNGQNGGIKDSDINPIKTSSDKEKVIAILDTGVDYNHSELTNIMWENPFNTDELPGKYGYDFINEDDDPMDDNGHGTHLAGIIAAETNNEEGIAGGVLGDSNVKIMALKTGDSNGARDLFSAISAYNYIYKAQQLGVNVVAINNSWSGKIDSSTIFTSELESIIDLVGQNGALSICAAGNDRLEIDNTGYSDDPINGKELCYPLGLNSDYIITVGATNENDELAWFSNYGDGVDIAAPGTAILSTIKECDSNGTAIKTFNPSIYSEEEKKEICSEFHNFDDSIDVDYEVDNGTVSLSSEKYFGPKGKSLKWTVEVTDDERGNIYTLKLKTKTNSLKKHFSLMVLGTGPESEARKQGDFPLTINYSGECGFSYGMNNIPLTRESSVRINGEETGYWSHQYNLESNEFADKYDDAIYIEMSAQVAGTYNIYIDDFAISEKTDIDIDNDYDFLSGTSMAAPYVAAAVATTSNLYENLTPLEIKEKFLDTAKITEGLQGKVVSGRLDISALIQSVTGVTLNKETVEVEPGNETTLIATISPDNATNKNIIWTSSNPDIATVNNGVVTGVSPGEVTITATTEDGNFQANCKVLVNKFNFKPKLNMSGYIYGDKVSNPNLDKDSNPGNGKVTYYYNIINSDNADMEWKNITPTSLDAGTYYMYGIVEETSNYKSTKTENVEFTILPKDINSEDIEIELESDLVAYNGNEQKPSVSISYGNNIVLIQGKDYIVKYSNNIEVGEATVEITGIGNYTGTKSKTFTIVDGPSIMIEYTINGEIVDLSQWTNKDIIATISIKNDDNKIQSITVNNVRLNIENEMATYKISNNGKYDIVVVDEEGNELTKTLTITNIDKTSPEITEIEEGKTYSKEVVPNAMDYESGIYSYTLTRNGEIVNNYKIGDKIKNNGTYSLSVQDMAGNINTKSFVIDIPLLSFKNSLPNTGKNKLLLVIIISTIATIISFIKVKQYKDVK